MSQKPQILLIGDSIRMGYCHNVRAELESEAEVLFPEGNCRCTAFVMESIAAWLTMCDPERLSAIHFNCGHWDAAQWSGEDRPLNTPEEYRANVERIIASLRRLFPNAKVAYATTTPMNPNGANSANPRTTERIVLFNEAGVQAAEKCSVMIDDLYAYTADWEADCYQDYCHFTPKHSQILGVRVAEFIRREL